MKSRLFMLVALTLGSLSCDSSSRRVQRGEDYLTRELRARVERLKVEVASEATSQETFASRVQLLWDWSNALSLTGVQMNPDLPASVSPPSRQPGATVPPARLQRIDMLIEELRLRDEVAPEAFGRLELDVTEPLVAASWQTVRQTYTVGEIPVEPGGGFLVGRHFQSYWFPSGTNFQTEDPGGEGYVTIQSSNSEARFEAGTIEWYGLHGIAEVGTPPVVFRLTGTRLEPGDRVTITYGDTTGGSQGLRIQNYSNDAVPLPLYLDFKGNDNFLFLPLQTYQVAGREVFAVHGFAPSTVETGETFTVSVRSEDRHLNRASGPIPAYRVKVNGKEFSRIEADEQAITLLEEVRFDEPGVYRFGFESPEGTITGHSNPIWVRPGHENHVFWGDTHGHSGFAEGLGTPDAYFRFAREDSRLDFLTHSEHDAWMDDYEWEVLRSNVQRFHAEGEFIAFLGYEWTVSTRVGGHHNVLFRTPEGRKRVPLQSARVLSQLYQRLAQENDPEDVLIIPHAHQAGEWRMSHPVMERLVEIMSGHGNFEWFGRRYLEFGHQVGFIAASDDHFSHPGYSAPFLYAYTQRSGLAAVQAPEKTSSAIFDALRARRTYATTGQRIILDLNLNGSPMGSRTEFSLTRRIQGQVMGTAPIDKVTLVKNGKDVESRDFLTVTSGGSRRVEVIFWSEADPQTRGNPRSWRRWDGTLVIKGANLVSLSAPSIRNRVLQSVSVSSENPREVDFALMTRGSEKSIILELDNMSRNALIEVEVKRAPDPVLAFYRRLTDQGYISVGILSLPGSARFRFRDLREGETTRTFSDGSFRDSITLRRIRSDAPLDQEFEFMDTENPLPGDNYYVRVTQLDDGVAWSSPIWVGGFAKQ